MSLARILNPAHPALHLYANKDSARQQQPRFAGEKSHAHNNAVFDALQANADDFFALQEKTNTYIWRFKAPDPSLVYLQLQSRDRKGLISDADKKTILDWFRQILPKTFETIKLMEFRADKKCCGKPCNGCMHGNPDRQLDVEY